MCGGRDIEQNSTHDSFDEEKKRWLFAIDSNADYTDYKEFETARDWWRPRLTPDKLLFYEGSRGKR